MQTTSVHKATFALSGHYKSMKYLPWLLPSRKKRVLFLFSCCFCKEGFLLFLARGFKILQFPNRRSYNEMRLFSVRISSWIYSSVPPLTAAQPELWLGCPDNAASFALKPGQDARPSDRQSAEMQLSCTHAVACDWLRLAWGSTWAVPTGGLCSGTQSVWLLTNGTPKDACSGNISACIHLSLLLDAILIILQMFCRWTLSFPECKKRPNFSW